MPDGVLSYVTTCNVSTGAVTITDVSYGTSNYSVLGQPTLTPVVFGTVSPVTDVMGYEFLYTPNLMQSIQTATVSSGFRNRMDDLFNLYQYFRVSKLTVILERLGKPVQKVLVVPEGGGLSANNPNSAGAQAYFQVCRFGNSYHSVRPADGAANWFGYEMEQMHAYGQMDYVYPMNRKSMIHVKDMARKRRLKFSFAPTVSTPIWVTGFDETTFGTPAGQQRYRPNDGVGGEFQPQKFKRFPWLPTVWKNNSGASPDDLYDFYMYGLCGALRPGSWRPADWQQWTMKSIMTIQFKRRFPGGDQNFGSVRPISTAITRWLPNASYNLQP